MRYVKSYKLYNESLSEDLESKLNKYKDIKKDLMDLIDKTIPDTTESTLVNFIDSYIEDKKSIQGLVNDADIYEFYLKYTNDVDEILSDINFYQKDPSEIDSFGLYDYTIKGTKISIKEMLKSLKEDLISKNESLFTFFKKKDPSIGKIVCISSKIKDKYNKYPIFVYILINKKEEIYESLLIGQLKYKSVVDYGFVEKKFIFELISEISDKRESKFRNPTKKETEIIKGYFNENATFKNKVESVSKTKLLI